MSLLTKTKFLSGLQCPKLLWVSEHDKDRFPEPDISTQYNLEQGAVIGNLAKQLFKDGVDLADLSFTENLQRTSELIDDGVPIFEAGFKIDFEGNELFCKVDILSPSENGHWDIIEVKSSTRVKEPNIEDVSFQKFCLERCGLRIDKCFLMHINNEYVREGDIEIDRLLTETDVTEDVESYLGNIESQSSEALKILDLAAEPNIQIGPYCSKPYDCPLKSTCWSFLPEGNVLELYRGGKKSWGLFEQGILKISEIPNNFKLTTSQNIQRDCATNQSVFIDQNNIKEFVDKLKYPLYYLDFETINPAIPKYDGIKPYQKVPFQYSLHIQENPESEPVHSSFLAKGNENPIPEFLKSLEVSLGIEGDIIVYNAAFEKSVLKDSCLLYPEYADWYQNNIEPRIKDLLIPFRSFHFYDPRQKGSASIKEVLPVLTDLSYDEMEIANGSQACIEYERVTFDPNVDPVEKEKVRQALEKYCELDTYAEVLILKELKEKINK